MNSRKTIAASLALATALTSAVMADPYTLVDGALTFNVDAADYPVATPYSYGDSLSGVTSIVKRGTGAVSLGTTSTANTFTGTITVEDGFLMGWKPRFGTPLSVTVQNGGAVVFTETTSQLSNPSKFANTQFTIAGAGPDGNGALQHPYATSGSADDIFLKNLTLSGDATINVGSNWGMQGGTLDMGNHVLTFSAAKYAVRENWRQVFVMSREGQTLTVKNPGAIVVTDYANIRINRPSSQAFVDAAGSNGRVADMTITLKNNGVLGLYKVEAGRFPCKVVAADGTSYIEVLNEDLSDADALRFSHITNAVEIDGTLNLRTMNGSEALVHTNSCLWLDGPVSGAGALTNATIGRVYLAGSSTNVFGSFSQTGRGEIVMQDDVVVSITNSLNAATYAHIGGKSVSRPAILRMKGNAKLLRLNSDRNCNLVIGDYKYGRYNNNDIFGILEIEDNAIVSNRVCIGCYGKGACYMFGGEFHMQPDAVSGNLVLGFQGGSYGYLGIDGGYFRAAIAATYIGTEGPGFIVQRGGRSRFEGDSLIGFVSANSAATIAILGGTSQWSNTSIRLHHPGSGVNPQSVRTAVTVSGETAVLDMSNTGIRANFATNSAAPVTDIVSLNDGGTLKARYMTRKFYDNLIPWSAAAEKVDAATRSYLNFNGGVLVTTRDGDFFRHSATEASENSLPFSRATVFENGATIDTDGHDVTWRLPLERPYGLGIASVTLPDGALASGQFIGPTRVYFENTGSGLGAEAMVDFDNTNRVARGMIVASHGFGYAAGTTCKVRKGSGSEAYWNCTVSTVDFDDSGFAHGGFTKRGAGRLTIPCANTYGGATRLEGGTLVLTDPQGFPGGNIEIPAAAVQGSLAAPLLEAHTLAFGAGKGIVVTEADTLDGDTFGQPKTFARLTTPLSSLPPVSVVASDGTPLSPAQWLVRLAEGGTELRLEHARATFIIMR